MLNPPGRLDFHQLKHSIIRYDDSSYMTRVIQMTKLITALLLFVTPLVAFSRPPSTYFHMPLESPVLRFADTNVYLLSDHKIMIGSDNEVVRGRRFILDVHLERQDGITFKKSLLSFEIHPSSPFVEFQKQYDDFFGLPENIGYEFKVFVLKMHLVDSDSDEN